ncbi:MAG: DUF4345 domain-containing protein [Proteobacteria bacterium]|nr:DUF4345 domain-containing protein [Pseudomonadota bacterium]
MQSPGKIMNGKTLYLALNSALYIMFGGWCLLKPEYTSTAVGFSLLGDQGVAEYMAVYGGLQLGVGAFYALAALNAASQSAALIFSVCLYAGLVLARCVAVLTQGSALGVGWYYFALELGLLALALFLRLKR